MSTLNPQVFLSNPNNKERLDYIQDVASQPNFDYPNVIFIKIYILIYNIYLIFIKHFI